MIAELRAELAAQLLRRCHELLETPPTTGCAAYVAQIKRVFQDALALRDRRDAGRVSAHGVRVSKGRLEARMDRILDDPDLDDESLRFALHLLRKRDALFLFLERPDVAATNFRAEQAIRPAVINRETSGGNRTPRGARTREVLMSVLRTCALRCVSAIEALKQMLHAPAPRVHRLGC